MTIPLQDDAAERRIAELIASFLNREQNASEIARTCWREATEAAALKCEEEKVDAESTGEEADIAYNSACNDCAAAIRGGKL